ncbi:hypothetical protein SBOR_9187 [Sclerotinia borealis F-4128]|uniref:2EXR domain-containing protein n=1 Tax=Sclerotinia borealis (strain F-4128) TaxID=1432307 RepID=W9C0U8_SCLBF|nr:hypothetical protein SBOR_9187 [Sclerotinia borealis F-4128]
MSTTTPAPSPATTHFPQFGLLPLELQRKIWRSTFPCSRTISLSYNISALEASRSPPPITLCICSESRAETLLHYTLIYRSEFPGSRGKMGGNCGVLLSRAMRQPICLRVLGGGDDGDGDVVGFQAGDLCGAERGRRRFAEWVGFLEGVDQEVGGRRARGGILGRIRGVELEGLDWENTMYVNLKYQEALGCKEVGEEYEGQGGVETWKELSYGALLRLGGLKEVRCRYAHVEYMGNFEEQLRRFLGFHKEVWGGRVPIVRRLD